jgi:hypothetical protein
MNSKLSVLVAAFVFGTFAACTAAPQQPRQEQQNTPGLLNDITGWHLPGWQFSVTEGWLSQYVFRGEAITPGAGLWTNEIDATVPGFAAGQSLTLGAWGGIQAGTSDYAGLPWKIHGTEALGPQLSHVVGTGRYNKIQAWTNQSAYRELDLTANYKLQLAPVILAEFGDIKYFSDFDASTQEHLHVEAPRFLFVATHSRYVTNHYTWDSSSENRNELYLKLSTPPQLSPWATPSLTYYETFNQQAYYNQFQVYSDHVHYYRGKYNQTQGPLYGGYLEGRVDGDIPWIKRNGEEIFGLRPYTVLSVSFNDETEGTAEYGRRFFTGWNNYELGTEAPWEVNKYVTVTATLALSHELAQPVASTRSNEMWGGVRATVRF